MHAAKWSVALPFGMGELVFPGITETREGRYTTAYKKVLQPLQTHRFNCCC